MSANGLYADSVHVFLFIVFKRQSRLIHRPSCRRDGVCCVFVSEWPARLDSVHNMKWPSRLCPIRMSSFEFIIAIKFIR